MLRHNNRGAGLVTVVTVLAVCGILLAGVLGFAYQHYKSVMLSADKTEQQAELDLLAQLLLKRTSDTDFSPVEAFYVAEGERVEVAADQKSFTVSLGRGNSLSCTLEMADHLEKWTVSYHSDAEVIVSRDYYYRWEDGTCRFADPPEASEETEAQA